MPLYTYRCSECGQTETAFRKIAMRDLLPTCHHGRQSHPMTRIIEAPYVAPDIGPYQAVAVDVATGKPPVINSRSAHREFLKRNGYVEVGNESVGRKAGEVRGDFNLRGDLTNATREVLGKTR
ncbi:zinc ribbon domain-containing protein [Burkholderia cenocepacia]|uniref:zinc ribbon domain-containing protein n=1 Tax=Burkholderia cenocepacia TaxID=95486 RepID=UPI001F36CB45|nr:zinc ribbon domain-containing protein [Burkholderia cenocepacia]MCF1367317.1 zinc ribbon domain-containing protein [Burkholderia cenocepacia]MCF1384850.1 zinc ribbon domain-containing protein [Burkholderia cenocepacia]